MDTSHYSNSMQPNLLGPWAKKMSVSFKNLFLKKNAEFRDYIPVLCYSGMSGVAHATALALELYKIGLKFHMGYVRKDTERSHGCQVETSNDVSDSGKMGVLVFVDDFISSGNTREYVVSKISNITNVKITEQFSLNALGALDKIAIPNTFDNIGVYIDSDNSHKKKTLYQIILDNIKEECMI